jgi:YjbE family integral membrane protein
MGFENLFHYVNLTLEVFVLNLLLSGDNAVVIALACRFQPPELMRRAMTIGIGGAIVLRILLTTVASLLLQIPLLKLAGGVALTVIAIKLTIAKSAAASDDFSREKVEALWPTVSTIIAADLVMSVDNVIALAAVAQGNILLLTLGLLMCVPLLIFGSLFVTALLKRYPLLIRGGGAMLGWIGGDIAISDPMIAAWVNQQSPALTVVVPILVVVFVLFESRIMEAAQSGAHALRPAPRSKAPDTDAPAAAVDAPSAEIVPEPEIVPAAEPANLAAQSEARDPVPAEELAIAELEMPREKKSKRMFWIVAILVLALLWILFKSLSLDFTSTTPAIQFTRPTGGG